MSKNREMGKDELIKENKKLKSRIKQLEKQIEDFGSNDLPYHQMILESISDAFFTLDGEMKFVHFNNKAEKLLGKKRDQVIGKHIFEEAFPEAKGSIFEKKYSAALNKKKISSFEAFFEAEPYKDWYDVKVYPLENGIAVFFNITTEMKKKEEELKAANRQLRANQLQMESTCQQLSASEQQLKASNQQLRSSDEQLRIHLHNLNNRIKELKCIQAIADIVEEEGLSIENILRRTVEVIPTSWQFPDIAYARIVLDDKIYTTEGFKDSDIKMVEPIIIHGKKAGSIEVHYSSKPPSNENTPFLREEEELIYLIAERLGKVITRIRAQKDLELKNQQLDASNQQLNASKRELNESRERLELIIKGSSDASWDWDLVENELVYSDEWWSQIGYEPDELPNDADLWRKLLHPDDLDRINSFLKSQLESNNENYQTAMRLKHSDGHYISVLTRGYISRDKMGNPLRISGSNLNLTRYKEIDRVISEGEHRLKKVLDSTPFPVAIVDKDDDRIFYWSKSAKEMFGHVADRTEEWYRMAFPDPGYRKKIVARWKESLDSIRGTDKVVNTGEYKVTGKDGSTRICEIHARFIDEDLVVTFNDITEQKKAQESLKKSILELNEQEEQVAAHNKQLKESEQQLRAANQQLAANEQQLMASNQQLSALNQQLRSSEQQLKASNQQLEALNQQLMESQISLKETMERLDLAMKASNDGLYDWNLVTNEIYYSPGWKRMLGYGDDELPNDFSIWEDLTDPEDVKRSWKMQQELVKGQRDRFEMEFRMKHKNGHWVDILSRAEARFDENGKAVRIVGTHVDITGMKRIMNELEIKENEKSQMLMKMMNAFVLFESVFDDDGKFVSYRFVYINEAYERITGVKNDEVKGKTVHEVWPETEPEWIKRYGEVAVTGKSQSFELYHGPTGKDYFCNVYRPYDSKDRFCVIFEDITERKRNERLLKENEKKFRSYVEHAPYGIFIADNKGVYVDVNPAAEIITGYPHDELIGMEMTKLIHYDDLEKAKDVFEELKTKKELISNEMRYVRKDGTVRYWVVTATPLSDERFLGFAKDITERKMAEISLRESETKLRNIIENSTNIFYTHGTDHVVTYVSPQCRDILGYEPQEAMRKWTDMASDHPMNEIGLNLTMKAIETGERQPTYDLQLVRKDGKKIWVEVRESPRVMDGKVIEIVGSLNDITDRKKVEDELQDKNRELNAMNQQLIASEEHLKKANTTLSMINSRLKESERLLRDTGKMARVGGWELDTKTENVTWSEETYRIHEIPKDQDPTLVEALQFFHPDDRPILQKAIQNAIENAEPYDLNLRFRSAKGKELITHTIGQPVIENGEVKKLKGTFMDVTAQKEAEKELLTEQYLLSKSQEIGKIGTWEFNIAENSLVWTDENYRIFGIPIGKPLTYETFLGCVHPDDREFVNEQWIRGMKTGEYDIDHRLLVEGKERWVREKAEIEYSEEDGTPVKAIGFTQDITILKEAESALKESEKKLRDVLDATPFPVAIVDSNDDKIFYWSKSAHDMFGHTGRTANEWYENAYPDPEYRKKVIERWKPKLELARKTGEAVETGEYEVTCKDGTVKICEIYAKFLPDNLIVTLNDITRRKKIENELLITNATLRAAMDNSQAGIAIAEAPSGLLKYVNKAGLLIRGSTENKVVKDIDINKYVSSWKLMDLDGKRELLIDEVPLARAIKYGEINSSEFIIRRKENEDRIVWANAAPIRNEEGKVTAGIVIFLDITEKKEYQKEIQKAKEEVEFYLDLLGHDLGNIHQGISGSLQLLQEKLDSDRMVMRILDLASESVDNATSLTKEVILLSRLRDREPELELINLKEILIDAMDQMKAAFPEKEIDFETGDIEQIIRAEPLIREMFTNILHNGIRLQDDNPWIRLDSRKENDGTLIFIEDKGPGIPDSMKQDLFKRFGLKGKKIRRGLGLSIAKVLVDRYNGEIWVEDRVDGDHTRGARFIINLPSQ